MNFQGNMNWIEPADRIQILPPYVFARLDRLKAEAIEKGVDLIDLGMGNPGGPTPQAVVEAAVAALKNPDNHGYPPFEGTVGFRRAITNWYWRRYGIKLDQETEALALLGSKEGLTHLAMAFVNPGDVVLTPNPAYPAHFRGPLIAGGQVHSINLKPENNWIIDLGEIPDRVAEQAKIFYFNYPSNPTGAIAPREFFEDMVAFARKHEIMLVHDLCYADIAFDGFRPTSLLEIPGAKEIGVEFNSLSKTYNMAGWRVGYAAGNSRILSWLGTLKNNLDYGLFAVIQAAAATALNLPDSYLAEVRERYRVRRDFTIQGLKDLGWNVPKTLATMYLWVPCPPGMSSTDFALSVLEKTGVVLTPGNAFGTGGEGYVRISLIHKCDRLGEALRRLKQANIRYQPELVSV